MNLYAKLQEREAQNKLLRVGLIGAGKFGAMYLAQVPKTPGIHLVGIADLSPANARANLERVGWPAERHSAPSLDAALKPGATHVGEDWQALVAHPAIDIVVEATGNPVAAVEHALAAFRNGKHVVMVTVEADAFCGPLLARREQEAGVVYSLAYGDQPALICDLVDWARASGFNVVAAGRGHKWQPHFAQSTPQTVWGYYGLTPEQARAGGLGAEVPTSQRRRHSVGDAPARGGRPASPQGPGRSGVIPRGGRQADSLDGEGGYTVVGRLMPAADSLAVGALPLGLAHGVKLLRPVAVGQPVTWADVRVDESLSAVRARREMERLFGARSGAASAT